MPEPKDPKIGGGKLAACTMVEADPFIVPSASGGCQGHHFDEYWTDHNARHNPDVPIRVFKDPSSTKYELYDSAKHAAYSFQEYHERTQAGSDVRDAPGGPWVGIILDYNG